MSSLKRKHVLWPLLALGLALAWLAVLPQPAFAQPPSCNDVITQLDGALAPGICQAIGLGNACLATRTVNATARTGTLRFSAPGNQAALNNISRMITVPQKGAAVLLGGSTANPVKILVFGDTATGPNAAQPGRVFTLRASNGQPTCQRTRSGMILQTPDGESGKLVVNGVTINLGSTTYIVPGADLMFDQDPRLDRREGRRNPDAPLCSGFDSDCDFGDDSCSEDDRLVYGPFCREDDYEYINPGLYRVTLYGEGEVQAGATDYNISFDYEMMGTQRFRLPGSYTFCWDGLEDGGTGFETIVQPRSEGAFVEHITLEYLGENCGLDEADNPRAGMGAGEMGVLTVYNLEGNVGVELPDGQGNAPDVGQRLRVYFDDDGEPEGMDEFPTDAPYILGSELAQWATSDGLPQVEIISTTTGTSPGAIVAAVDSEVLFDGDTPSGLRIEATAYDPAAGDDNGDGIEEVTFTISDAAGDVLYENSDDDAPYCAFDLDDTCEVALDFAGLGSGDFRVRATAVAESGREASASSSFALAFPTTATEPVISLDAEVLYDSDAPYAVRIEATAYDPAEGYGNGDGIDYVFFTISDDAGDFYFENDESETAYCAFGGDSPCEQSISPDEAPSGDYTVTATAYTERGAQASTSARFALDWGSVGGSGSVTPPEEVATVVPTLVPTEVAPTDFEAPYFSAVSSTAFEGRYCYGGSLTFNVDVNDNDSVADLIFWYRVYDSGQTPPSYEAYGLGSGNGSFEVTLSDLNADFVDVYFTATDNSGNEGATGVTSIAGNLCLR